LRFLIHWGLRRKDLCDPELCHDALEDGGRCDKCPLTKLEWAQQYSYVGQLLQRALNKMAAIRIGLTLTLDDITMDEMRAMLLIEEERDIFEKESQGR
jgi:hypothetical protein